MENIKKVIVDKKEFLKFRFSENEDLISLGDYCLDMFIHNNNNNNIKIDIDEIYYHTGYLPSRLILNKEILIDEFGNEYDEHNPDENDLVIWK